jgi:hypothetical protein
MSRKTRKKILAAAINEAVYGTDAIAAGTALFMQTTGLEITPIEGEDIDREIDTPELGNSARMLVGDHVKISTGIELTGSGTATNNVPYYPVLAAAGWKATPGAGEVVYSKVTDNTEKDVTFYGYKDGALHKATGSRATLTFMANVNEVPKLDAEVTGLFNGIQKEPLPNAPDLSAFLLPQKVGATHTKLTVNGQVLEMYEFELSENIEVIYDENTEGEEVFIGDYAAEGKIVVKAPDLDTFDPFTIALAEDQIPLRLEHGTGTGRELEINVPKIQFQRPAYGDREGQMTYEINFWVIGSDYTLTSR